jgi:hypothetical protein
MLKTSLVKMLNGYGSSLTMCYGVTNSGKTYTMTGEYSNPEKRGLLLRYVQDLLHMKAYLNSKELGACQTNTSDIDPSLEQTFNTIYEQRGQVNQDQFGNLRLVDLNIRFEVIEVYNNKVYDLIQMCNFFKGKRISNPEGIKK